MMLYEISSWKQTSFEISPIVASGLCFIRTTQSLSADFVEHKCEGDGISVGHRQPHQAEKSNIMWTDSPCTEHTKENKQELKLPS